jgi:hypothetical protein
MLSSGERKAGKPVSLLLLAFLFSFPGLTAQTGILDSLISVSAGNIKRSTAFNILTGKTGYYFTFDANLINPSEKVDLNFSETKLSTILDSISGVDSITYSVINKYIILYKRNTKVPESAPELKKPPADRVSGKVVDAETGDPLPFAAVGIVPKGRGTVTNSNGYFELRITPDCINDSLTVAYLGYFNKMYPVSMTLDGDFVIKMNREYIPIPEIIIRTQIPQEIMRKAYISIPVNFGSTPTQMTAFYREAAQRRSVLQIYSEAIIEIYKTGYNSIINSDQVKVLKSRKIENTSLRDTLTVRLKAGLNSSLMLDGARNTFDFLQPENFPQYNYRMTDIVTIDGESAYVIEFAQREFVDIPLYKGAIYITTDKYAVVQAEFELNPQLIHKSREDFVTYQAKGYRIWPTTMKYTVSYKRMGDRYYLNHVRGDLNFSARQKNRLFSTPFLVFFELAVNNIKTENVSRFDRSDITPVHSVFSRQITKYDPEFWGDMDFLRPEENLLQALKNMKAKLQEFTKE